MFLKNSYTSWSIILAAVRQLQLTSEVCLSRSFNSNSYLGTLCKHFHKLECMCSICVFTNHTHYYLQPHTLRPCIIASRVHIQCTWIGSSSKEFKVRWQSSSVLSSQFLNLSWADIFISICGMAGGNELWKWVVADGNNSCITWKPQKHRWLPDSLVCVEQHKSQTASSGGPIVFITHQSTSST